MADEIVHIEPYWYNESDCLGTGAFGEVYKGYHDKDKTLLLAIKKIRKGSLAQNIIDQEIQILQELSRPEVKNAHFVTLIDSVQTEKHVHLVMEFCNGRDLDHYLQEKKKMDTPSLRIFLRQIASAMKILHDNDIIHRDLKPANILLSHNGLTDVSHTTFKIADFGLGRFLDAGDQAKTFCGTLAYMAPEMLVPNAKYDYKVDLYSIGAIVHKCFTGDSFCRPPQKLTSNMDSELRDLIIRLLLEDPKERINFDDFFKHPFIEPKKAENCAVFVGFNDGLTVTKDVVKINLCRPREISSEVQLPATIQMESFAAVYCNTMYVVGIGVKCDEIWKYNVASGWTKCASLVQGRRKHSAAFIDTVLYICGGFADSDKSVLWSIEAYDAVNDKCTTAGDLIYRVKSSGNCVPFKSSIYIFGGKDADSNEVKRVQVYNTKENTSSVLSVQMPRPCCLMRAVLWKTSAILLGYNTCFIFNFEKETWQERDQFKTDVVHFGLVLENKQIYVIGGGDSQTDKDGRTTWKCRNDVRSVPLQHVIDNDKPIEWKIRATLPQPSLLQAFTNVLFPV